jgi:hypothetical protein
VLHEVTKTKIIEIPLQMVELLVNKGFEVWIGLYPKKGGIMERFQAWQWRDHDKLSNLVYRFLDNIAIVYKLETIIPCLVKFKV